MKRWGMWASVACQSIISSLYTKLTHENISWIILDVVKTIASKLVHTLHTCTRKIPLNAQTTAVTYQSPEIRVFCTFSGLVPWHALKVALTISVSLRWIKPNAAEFLMHDDVIKWKHLPRYWPFVRGIQRSTVVSFTEASDAGLWCFLGSAPEQTAW